MIKQLGIAFAALLALNASASKANADAVAGGTIIGVFSDVVTHGEYLNYPTLGQKTYIDNAGTAVYSISNSSSTALTGTPPIQTTGSSVQWGAYAPGNGVDPADSFSKVEFFGAQAPANIHDPFQIGTITYLNGTSELQTQAFGATLSFYVGSVGAANYLGSDAVYFNITNNFYQSVPQDADWINICGNNSNICNSRVEADETYEGGTGVTANLYGSIVGDPQLILTSVTLAPGQSAATNGFIGSGGPESIPEPASLAIFGAGIAGFAAARRRKRC